VTRLPVISGDEFAKAMHKVGYVWDHTEGSHLILLHHGGVKYSLRRDE